MKSPDGSNVKTILVVEDESVITSVCQRVLTNEGFEVNIATNGKVAQSMIEKNHYALCLIDIRTPEINGMELFQWLKDRHSEIANRVIFTTGDVMGGEVTGFIEQSGMPFLPKPFTPDELKAIVKISLKQV
ncbi:response regulator [Chloroflexota bacterium]